MSRYAEGTQVSSEKSRSEIEHTLQRYGATSFAYGWDVERVAVSFKMHDRQVRFVLAMPPRDAKEFTHTPSTKQCRTAEQAHAQWERACRQRWRALALIVKAKLEAVAAGITEFEDEFLAHLVLPSGETAGEWLRPQIAEAYERGIMPPSPMLGLGTGSGHQ